MTEPMTMATTIGRRDAAERHAEMEEKSPLAASLTSTCQTRPGGGKARLGQAFAAKPHSRHSPSSEAAAVSAGVRVLLPAWAGRRGVPGRSRAGASASFHEPGQNVPGAISGALADQFLAADLGKHTVELAGVGLFLGDRPSGNALAIAVAQLSKFLRLRRRMIGARRNHSSSDLARRSFGTVRKP